MLHRNHKTQVRTTLVFMALCLCAALITSGCLDPDGGGGGFGYDTDDAAGADTTEPPQADTHVGGNDTATEDTWTGGGDTSTAWDTGGGDTGSLGDTGSGTDTSQADTGTTDTGTTDTGTTDTSPSPGALCADCENHDECGGQFDLCLRNNNTGETFCGQHCTAPGQCPSGYQCADVGGIGQCVPTSETCGETEPPPTCDPACQSGFQCIDGQCVEGGEWEAELQHCVDVINQHRADGGLAPLQRGAALEDCAMAGALEDSQTGEPHGHFQRTNGCNLTARRENEIPGWSSGYGSVMQIIELGTQSMMDEGPGGGHHDAIMDPNATAVGCGIAVTDAGDVWIVQDFR